MTLWPRSFLARSVAANMIGLVLAQLVTIGACVVFIAIPQSQRAVDVVAQSVVALTTTAAALGPEERSLLIAQVNEAEFVEVWPDQSAPEARGPSPRVLERMFMQRLVDRLPNQNEVEWISARDGTLWLHLAIGPEMHWVSIRAPETLQPAQTIAAAAFITLSLTLAGSVFAQRRIVKPLATLAARIQAYRPGETPQPVASGGPPEIQALADGFNAMIVRLKDAEDQRALMLAGVSHDIRAPLAKLRLAVEMLGSGDPDLSAGAARQIAEIDRIVDQFVAFSRTAEAESVSRFDLEALVHDAVSACDAPAGTVEVRTGDVGLVLGRPEMLRRAVCNLVHNAMRHGQPPVLVRTHPIPGGWRIEVEDAGPGVADHLLERLAVPFFRADEARGLPGSGLGLSIVKAAAAAHGGALRLRRGSSGGMLVTIEAHDRAPAVPDGSVSPN